MWHVSCVVQSSCPALPIFRAPLTIVCCIQGVTEAHRQLTQEFQMVKHSLNASQAEVAQLQQQLSAAHAEISVRAEASVAAAEAAHQKQVVTHCSAQVV